MKWPLTIPRMMVIGILILLVFGYAAGAVYLNTTASRDVMLQELNAAIDGRLTVEDHYLALHTARLELSGVRLTDANGEPLVSIERMSLRISWLALLWRTLHIKSCIVEKPLIHLGYDLQDQLRTVKPAPSTKPPEIKQDNVNKWSVRLENFSIDDGAIRFVRPSKGWSGTLEDLKISAGIDSSQPNGHVKIVTGPLQWQQQDTAMTLPSLNISAAVDSTRNMVMEAETNNSKVMLRGRLDGLPTHPILDVVADIDVLPSEFHDLLPQLKGLNGRVNAHITAKGNLMDPTVSVTAELADGDIKGVPIAHMKTDFRMHRRIVTIDTLRSQSAWGVINLTGRLDLRPVFQGGFNTDTVRWDKLSYKMKLEGSRLQPDKIEMIAFPVGGKLNLQGEMSGVGLAGLDAIGKAHLDIQASGLSPRQGAPQINGRLSTDIERKGPAIAFKAVKARIGRNNLQAEAQINITTRRIDQAKADVKIARLEELGRMLGIAFPSGKGSLKISGHGPFQQPTGKIEILANELTMGSHPLGRILAEARVTGQGRLDINRMILENKGSLVKGSGHITLFRKDGGIQSQPGIDLDLDFRKLAPKDFGLTDWAQSHFNGRVKLEGSIPHLTAQAVVDESVVQSGGFDGRLRANARWEGGRLTVEDLKMYKETSSIHLKGTADWRRTGSDKWLKAPIVEAHIYSQKLRLQDFIQGPTGTLIVEGRVFGPTTDIDGEFKVSGTNLTAGGQPFNAIEIQGQISENKVLWDTMEIALEKEQVITSRGWYAFNRNFALTMTARDIGLSHVAALQKAYPIDGRLDLNIEANGTLDAPQLDGNLVVRKPRLNDQPWDDFHLTAQIRERRLKLTADLNFDLTADYQLDSGDFDVQAKFDRSDLSPYLAVWVGSDWAGNVSGHLQASGNRKRPEQIQGSLFVKDTELKFQNQKIISARQLTANLENGRLEVPASRMNLLDDGFVDLSAMGQLPNDLKIASDGRVPMAAISPFIGSLAPVQGELAFKTLIQGPMDKLAWQATLDLNNAGFEVPGLAQQVENLTGRLEITPASLMAKDLTGLLDGGRFSLNGQMSLNQWHPSGGRMTLNAQALPLQWPDTMDVVLNGDLNLTVPAETPVLSGKLVLLEGAYYKDVRLNLLSAVTQPKRAVPVSSTYAVPGKWGKTLLDVAITHRYPLLVDNNLANLQIAPDLKISGTVTRPILSGRAQVTEGQVIFRRKSFEVKRGVVDFINPYKIEPNLDIVAEADIRQWRVALSLSGPTNHLVFKLTSNPPESENDILSLILLGRTGSELAQGKGGRNQTTRQMLASLVATAWGEDVKKQTGMDILEVETGSGDDQESADRVQVTVGKKLSRRLTVKYEVESGSEELVQRAISEYQFLEQLLASGFQDSKGGYGGELVFRIEF